MVLTDYITIMAEADQKDGFWGENLSSNKSGMGLDAYTLKDSTVQVVGSFAYSGDDKDNLKAVNMLMKIDDEALQPSASASDGVPTSNNFKVDVRLLYGAKKAARAGRPTTRWRLQKKKIWNILIPWLL